MDRNQTSPKSLKEVPRPKSQPALSLPHFFLELVNPGSTVNPPATQEQTKTPQFIGQKAADARHDRSVVIGRCPKRPYSNPVAAKAARGRRRARPTARTRCCPLRNGGTLGMCGAGVVQVKFCKSLLCLEMPSMNP